MNGEASCWMDGMLMCGVKSFIAQVQKYIFCVGKKVKSSSTLKCLMSAWTVSHAWRAHKYIIFTDSVNYACILVCNILRERERERASGERESDLPINAWSTLDGKRTQYLRWCRKSQFKRDLFNFIRPLASTHQTPSLFSFHLHKPGPRVCWLYIAYGQNALRILLPFHSRILILFLQNWFLSLIERWAFKSECMLVAIAKFRVISHIKVGMIFHKWISVFAFNNSTCAQCPWAIAKWWLLHNASNRVQYSTHMRCVHFSYRKRTNGTPTFAQPTLSPDSAFFLSATRQAPAIRLADVVTRTWTWKRPICCMSDTDFVGRRAVHSWTGVLTSSFNLLEVAINLQFPPKWLFSPFVKCPLHVCVCV